MTKTYLAVYEKEATYDTWNVRVDSVPGCRAQGQDPSSGSGLHPSGPLLATRFRCSGALRRGPHASRDRLHDEACSSCSSRGRSGSREGPGGGRPCSSRARRPRAEPARLRCTPRAVASAHPAAGPRVSRCQLGNRSAIHGPKSGRLPQPSPHAAPAPSWYNGIRQHSTDLSAIPTDQKVGGSSPSERAEGMPRSQARCHG